MRYAHLGRLCCALSLLGPAGVVAHAAPVKGQVNLAPDRAEAPPEGLWRVDNGLLPVAARTVDLHSECVVVLVPRGDAHREMKKEEPVTAELRGLRLVPQVIALPLGAALDIKNEDRVPHALWLRNSEEVVVAPKATPAGGTRSERIQRPGVFEVRDEEQPHLRGWVVIADGAHVLRLDEHGAFRGDVPDGRYVLRVFARGGFVLERNVDVSSKLGELVLNVPAPAPAEPHGATR